MPILKSAIKKLRQDKKRAKFNRVKKETLKKLIKEAIKSKSNPKIIKATSFIDKMGRKNLIHKNKAARLKSRLAKLKKPSLTKKDKSSRLKS